MNRSTSQLRASGGVKGCDGCGVEAGQANGQGMGRRDDHDRVANREEGHKAQHPAQRLGARHVPIEMLRNAETVTIAILMFEHYSETDQ